MRERFAGGKRRAADIEAFRRRGRALIAADVAELSRIFADDYVQCDESGKAFTKQDVINNLRSGAIRYISRSREAAQFVC